MPQIATFSVDAGAVLKEIERDFTNAGDRSSPGIVMACQIIRIELHAIGLRAIALGDNELLTSLARLGVIKADT